MVRGRLYIGYPWWVRGRKLTLTAPRIADGQQHLLRESPEQRSEWKIKREERKPLVLRYGQRQMGKSLVHPISPSSLPLFLLTSFSLLLKMWKDVGRKLFRGGRKFDYCWAAQRRQDAQCPAYAQRFG